MKGLEQRKILHRVGAKVNRVQALDDWSHEGQKRSTSSSLRFQLIWKLTFQGGFKFCKTAQESASGLIFTIETELGVFTIDLLSLLLFLLLPDNSGLFFYSFKIIISGTFQRVSIVAKLRSQNGIGQNGFSNVKKLCLVLFLQVLQGPSYPICLYLLCSKTLGSVIS